MKNQYLRTMAEGLLHLADTMPDCKDNADDVMTAVAYVGSAAGHAVSIMLDNRDDIPEGMNAALEAFKSATKNHETVH